MNDEEKEIHIAYGIEKTHINIGLQIYTEIYCSD